MDIETAEYKNIAFSRRGRILTASLNRPHALNAVHEEMHEELSRLFADLEADSHSDVLVLTGAGQAFCAGGDIKWLYSTMDDSDVFERTATRARKILFSQLEVTKPLITRLNGSAVGLGASMALFSDIIIAVSAAKICDPHVAVGLAAGDGGAIIWPHLIGHARAKQYLMTGDALTAEEAERIGLINKVVAPADLDAAVEDFSDRLSQGALRAIRWTKVIVNAPLKQMVHQLFEVGAAYEALSSRTSDHREAVTAFCERRKPDFNGH